MKLRQSRNAQYLDVFQKFSKNRKIEELIETLKDVIEDNLQLSASKLGDAFNKKLQNKNNQEESLNNYLIRQYTKKEKLEEIFEMAYQTDFMNLKIGDVLLQQFESGQNQEII